VPQERGALNADGIHHRAHVVHALLERRNAADPVGRARAALVEADHPHSLGQLAEVGARSVIVELHRREVHPAREHEVERPRAEDAIGDVDVAAPRVPGVGALHASKW
jgi:hypothetical protein